MSNLTFAGMVGILDPPREGVCDAIYTLMGSGVNIKMVTGDSEQTAKAVGKRTAYTVKLFVSCLTCQQQASVSQGQICSDNFTCCHTEIEAADQTFYLTQSQYTDTGRS